MYLYRDGNGILAASTAIVTIASIANKHSAAFLRRRRTTSQLNKAARAKPAMFQATAAIAAIASCSATPRPLKMGSFKAFVMNSHTQVLPMNVFIPRWKRHPPRHCYHCLHCKQTFSSLLAPPPPHNKPAKQSQSAAKPAMFQTTAAIASCSATRARSKWLIQSVRNELTRAGFTIECIYTAIETASSPPAPPLLPLPPLSPLQTNIQQPSSCAAAQQTS